jgi:hypothetical protein
MRFMMIVKGDSASEAGVMPSKELVETMTAYNEALVKSGVLLAAEGLHPTSKGFKKRIVGDRHTIVDGPFTEAKEIVAGFWLLQVKSREEMVAWAMRCPAPVEVRQVFDFADFPAELQEAAASETELRAQIERQHQS